VCHPHGTPGGHRSRQERHRVGQVGFDAPLPGRDRCGGYPPAVGLAVVDVHPVAVTGVVGGSALWTLVFALGLISAVALLTVVAPRRKTRVAG